MRVVLAGTTQNLHALMLGIDPRWPQVNVDRLQLWMPTSTEEAGNAAAAIKIGGPALTTTFVDVEDYLQEGDRASRSSTGGTINAISLKSIWVRSSAASVILIVDAHPA